MSLQRIPASRWLALLGLAALCGCQPEAPIKVGFIGGMTGRGVTDLAVDGRNGAQLAIETLNARDGPRYELVVHDDEQSPEKGRADVAAAADEGDAFAIGPMTSALAAAMVSEADRRRFVLISPTANSDALSGRDDYFFRVIAAARPGAELFARAAIARGFRRAAVLMDWHNRTYTEGFAAAFGREFVARGGAAPTLVHYDTAANPDYAQLAAQALAGRPQIVLLVNGAADASIAAQQLRRLDAHVQLAMASWAANAQLLQIGGRAVEGALVLQALDLDSRAPAYLDFLRRYQARYDAVAGQAAVYAYQAAMMGAQALAQRAHGQDLRDVLRTHARWDGLQSPVVLDRFGDSQTPFHLSEVRDGRFVMLPSP